MNTTKIIEDEIRELKIASLPSRPTAPASFGGRGYTASEMKAAFDKLPLFIIERFNSLLDDIASADEGSLSSEIPTGISEGHTLMALFGDITSGVTATYLSLGDMTLEEYKMRLEELFSEYEAKFDELYAHVADSRIDGGSPMQRNPENGGIINE